MFQCLNCCVYLAYKSCFLDDGSLTCVFCNLVIGSSCCTHLSTSHLLLCAQPERAAAKVICLVKTCHVERPQHFRFRRKEEWGVIVFSAVFTQLWWFAHDSLIQTKATTSTKELELTLLFGFSKVRSLVFNCMLKHIEYQRQCKVNQSQKYSILSQHYTL